MNGFTKIVKQKI